MDSERTIERLFEALVNGDRAWAREVIAETEREGVTPEDLMTEVLWPVYENVTTLFRNDQLTTLGHHLATRLLRTICDRTALRFEAEPSNGRTVFAVCGPTDADELAAEMAVDLLEREGFTVSFAGGGIAADEIMEVVQERQPDVLLLFASAPSDLPETRGLIDRMREIGACDGTQIVVGGGVYNRAEGLAEEIGADLWATSPTELVATMIDDPTRRAESDQRTVGRKRLRSAKAA